MAEKQGIPTTPVEHVALLELCNKKDDDPVNPAEYKFLAPEKISIRIRNSIRRYSKSAHRLCAHAGSISDAYVKSLF